MLPATLVLRAGLLLLIVSAVSVVIVLVGVPIAKYVAFVSVPLGAVLVLVAVIAAHSGRLKDDLED
jgi:hypothetical protein